MALIGIPRAAKSSVAGIKSIHLALKADIGEYTITAGVVTFTTALIADFKEYVMAKETGSFSDTYTFSPATGQHIWEQSITSVFAEQTVAKQTEFDELTASDLVAIVTDFNDLSIVVGLERGIDITSLVKGTGVDGTTDLNGATLTFMSKSKVSCPSVASTFFDPVV